MAAELAEELLKAGEQLQADRALQIANDSFRPGDDMHYDCMECLHLGKLWLQVQNRAQAEGLLAKARTAALEYERQPPKFDYPYNRAAMWGGIASVSQKVGEQQGAREAIAKAKTAATSHRRPGSQDDHHLEDQIRAYQSLAVYQRELGNVVEARQALNQAIKLAMQLKSIANQGELFFGTREVELDMLAGDEIKRGDTALAKELLARADLAPVLHRKLCDRMAIYHAARKERDVALEYMRQEDELLRKCQLTPDGKGISLAQMAQRYAELGQQEQAKKCMQEATELATPALPLLQSTIVITQIEMGELEEAHAGIQAITDADSKVFLLLHLLSAIQTPRVEAYKARTGTGR
jgi:tetratricopeptide (TPR) repeat protein